MRGLLGYGLRCEGACRIRPMGFALPPHPPLGIRAAQGPWHALLLSMDHDGMAIDAVGMALLSIGHGQPCCPWVAPAA